MKLPSLQALVSSTIATCKRFPLAIFFVILASWHCIRYNHLSYSMQDLNRHYINIALSCYLGLLMSLVATVFCERLAFRPGGRVASNVAVLVLAVLYYYTLPQHYTPIGMMRFFLFVIGVHLLLAFIPFLLKDEVNGFWQYNKSLFIRILTAAFYSLVLYLGLSLALLAVEKLFGVNVRSKWYADLLVVIAGVFNTVFFLAAFPKEFEKLEYQTDYPKGLKIFAQYVLIPLISIYLLILYAYMFKIIFSRQWPYGWVSYLVLAYAVAGILSLLLIHPARNEAGNKWILLYNRFFYFALCPLMVMLFLSIEKRIHSYGITEERYFVMALACWLSFIALYFIFSKSRNIKIIPMSLCILTFLASFGPWGAFSVSLNSQRSRLQLYLVMNNMLKEGKTVIPAVAKLHKGDATEVSSIVRYLLEVHGHQSLQSYFTQNLDTMLQTENRESWNANYQQTEKLLAFMRVDEKDDKEVGTDQKYFGFSSETRKMLMSTAGFDYLISNYSAPSYYSNGEVEVDTFPINNRPVIIQFMSDSGRLLISNGGSNQITFQVRDFARTLRQHNYGSFLTLNQDSLILSGENDDLLIKCFFHDISGYDDRKITTINRLSADILLKLKYPKEKQ